MKKANEAVNICMVLHHVVWLMRKKEETSTQYMCIPFIYLHVVYAISICMNIIDKRTCNSRSEVAIVIWK